MEQTRLISKIVAGLIFGGVIVVLLLLLVNDLAWAGSLQVKTDFLKFTPYFSILKPQDRVTMSEINYLKAEPIYFDLYLPRDFDKATVKIEYKNEFGYKISLGPNIKSGWDLKPLEDLPVPSKDYKIKSTEFDLADKNINNGKLRFMLSIPDLKDENMGVYLKSISVDLTRKPIWQDNIGQNLLNYFKYVKNQF
ncbi:MAG: hypothetical protein NTX82_01710 [Candidatus Parcubacteria bacterium]|nr:hypothetical protein [Candidatus Parcubacteria bacterium]